MVSSSRDGGLGGLVRSRAGRGNRRRTGRPQRDNGRRGSLGRHLVSVLGVAILRGARDPRRGSRENRDRRQASARRRRHCWRQVGAALLLSLLRTVRHGADDGIAQGVPGRRSRGCGCRFSRGRFHPARHHGVGDRRKSGLRLQRVRRRSVDRLLRPQRWTQFCFAFVFISEGEEGGACAAISEGDDWLHRRPDCPFLGLTSPHVLCWSREGSHELLAGDERVLCCALARAFTY